MVTVVYKGFEWDKKKAASNEKNHFITFKEAVSIFSTPHYFRTSFVHKEYQELRYISVGVWQGKEITVIYTLRKKRRRIISARRSRDYEKEHYQDYLRKIGAAR